MVRLTIFIGVFAIVGIASAFLGALGYVTVAAIQQLLSTYEPWVAWSIWGVGALWVITATTAIGRWMLRRKAPTPTSAERVDRQVIVMTPGDIAKLAELWRKELPRGE